MPRLSLGVKVNDTDPHRAMFKLGGKNLIVLCLLIKIVSAVSSADRCNSKESEKAVWDLNWIGGDISSDTAHNSEHFSHFRFPIPVANWQFLIKVWTYVIGLSCLLRTMLEYQKVRQVWTLQYGWLEKSLCWVGLEFIIDCKVVRHYHLSLLFLYIFYDLLFLDMQNVKDLVYLP